jgi:DNA-binding beta-propeller fold protein YncE
VGPTGTIYAGTWCGPDNGAVLQYDSAGVFQSVFAAVGTFTGSCEVNGLARDDSGNVYVAQNSSNRIAKFGPAGSFVGFLTAASFSAPSNVFFNPVDGLLYVGNDADARLTILTTTGSVVATVSMGGSGIGTPGLVR